MLALICALLAAGLAGYSRGFAAFGTAMIYIPLVTLAYDAKTAVVTLILVDLAPSLPLLWKAAPRCDRRTVLWMVAGAIALSPVGVAVLVVADQAHSQFALGAILLAAVSYMVLRPDFRIRTTPINSVGAGAVSGFAGGICGMFGPPAMVYLIGRSENPLDSRADMIVYLSSESIVLGITYFLYDMYTAWYFELSPRGAAHGKLHIPARPPIAGSFSGSYGRFRPCLSPRRYFRCPRSNAPLHVAQAGGGGAPSVRTVGGSPIRASMR
jgi:uncharacterized membrane protein YfcA